MSLHKEINFETEICQHLASNYWTALISAAVTGQIDVRNT